MTTRLGIGDIVFNVGNICIDGIVGAEGDACRIRRWCWSSGWSSSGWPRLTRGFSSWFPRRHLDGHSIINHGLDIDYHEGFARFFRCSTVYIIVGGDCIEKTMIDDGCSDGWIIGIVDRYWFRTCICIGCWYCCCGCRGIAGCIQDVGGEGSCRIGIGTGTVGGIGRDCILRR